MGLKENQALAKQYPILQFFQYNHLPPELQKISAPFCTLAWKMARELPKNAETSTALRNCWSVRTQLSGRLFTYNEVK